MVIESVFARFLITHLKLAIEAEEYILSTLIHTCTHDMCTSVDSYMSMMNGKIVRAIRRNCRCLI